MNKRLTKGDPEFEMFREFYTLYQDYYTPENTDEYWDAMAEACVEFLLKYKSGFATDIIAAYITSREAMARNIK